MKLTVETLAHAISNFIDSYESTDALTILRDEFRLTDDEIREMGLDYLFDFAEEDEPNEEPLKTYNVEYSVQLKHTFEIQAHNSDEAWDIAEEKIPEVSYSDMICELGEYFVSEKKN